MKLKELLALTQDPTKYANEDRRIICVQITRHAADKLQVRATLRGVGRKVHHCNAGFVKDMAQLMQVLVAKSVPVLPPA